MGSWLGEVPHGQGHGKAAVFWHLNYKLHYQYHFSQIGDHSSLPETMQENVMHHSWSMRFTHYFETLIVSWSIESCFCFRKYHTGPLWFWRQGVGEMIWKQIRGTAENQTVSRLRAFLLTQKWVIKKSSRRNSMMWQKVGIWGGKNVQWGIQFNMIGSWSIFRTQMASIPSWVLCYMMLCRQSRCHLPSQPPPSTPTSRCHLTISVKMHYKKYLG